MGETLRTVLAAVLGGAVAAAASITAASLGYFNKDRELDIAMVRISLSILKGENKGTDTLPARRFALRALQQFSRVGIPDAELEEWVQRGTVPYATVTDYHFDTYWADSEPVYDDPSPPAQPPATPAPAQ